MKKCDTCIYRNENEYHKPCVVYRDDCEHYESEEDMNEVGVEIVKTEETEENEIKHLNINVSNSEVERKPDIVRLCADAGILEYVKPKTGHWIRMKTYEKWGCSECSTVFRFTFKEHNYCPNCGARMESEDKE